MSKYRFLILRRVSQIGIFALFILANVKSLNVLKGNLSSSLFLDTLPLADPYAVLQMFCAGAILGTDILLGALVIVLFYGIFGGRAFCAWVCPINLVSDLANYLRKVLSLKDQKYIRLGRNFRYYILAISLAVSFVLGYGAFEMISPIGIFSREIIFGIGLGSSIVLCIFLFDIFVLKNGWCGYVCPLGAFYSLIGQFSIFRVRYDDDKCTKCMKCKAVCPEADVLHVITKRSSLIYGKECTNCARCIEVCDDDALNFSLKKLGEKNVKK